MTHYSSIHILYNPNSTGDSKQLATELHKRLKATLSKLPVELVATTHAGHATELTYDLAKKYNHPLIVSVSGDGGYNEVVNGAAKAYNDGLQPITAVLGAGNANDHYNSLHKKDLFDAIVDGDIHTIDILKLSFTKNRAEVAHRAHSYIGLGITPSIGKELTEAKLGFFTEIGIVVKGLLHPRYARIIISNKLQAFDSIIFSNIDRMAKVLQLSDKSAADDGKFEVHLVAHKSRWHLYQFLRRAIAGTASEDAQVNTFAFKTIKPLTVQCDGETVDLPGKTEVSISIDEQQLRCVY